jgi:acyl-CoA reductase-like NAD-dependent aldehyde dehydrogenase
MHIVNPSTEELIMEMAEDSWQVVQDKWRIVREGQPAWAAVPVEKRIACIARFANLLEKEQQDLATTLTLEMGKPLWQSRNELAGARGRIEYFVKHSEKYLCEEWITPDGATREKIVYEPLGVIANISAWNYPYLVGVNVFIPALIAGNAVLYKPSEFTTLTGLHIARLLYEAGVPENCFQLVSGKGPTGEHLLKLPLNGYFFTGSYKTGLHIATAVAPKLVPCQLELGGKDPLYVMDDVEDISKTATEVLEGVVYNNGQSCCAVERIYVQENTYEAFIQAITEQAKSLKIGDPMDPSTQIGPLARLGQLEFLLAQISDAVQKGARVLTGGARPGATGYFIEPTLLADVNHTMKLMTDESFGPVVGIQRVSTDQEALELMQDTPYGLTASIYSKNYDRAATLMQRLNTGTVYWNCCDRVSASLPWSGRKNSGLGTTLSYQGIRAFVQPKAYHIRGLNK